MKRLELLDKIAASVLRFYYVHDYAPDLLFLCPSHYDLALDIGGSHENLPDTLCGMKVYKSWALTEDNLIMCINEDFKIKLIPDKIEYMWRDEKTFNITGLHKVKTPIRLMVIDLKQ